MTEHPIAALLRAAAPIGVIAALVALAACAASHASSDPVMRHVLAINFCYSREEIKVHYVDGAIDRHAVRTCYNDRVGRMQPGNNDRLNAPIVRVATPCEHLIDTTNDDAMIEYRNCIFKGLTKLGTPPPP